MATKTANVLARIEPEVKEQAESILSQLGISASAVINMLYKQIIFTKSIPFPLSTSTAPQARNEMNVEQFNAIMQQGLDDVKSGSSRPAGDVFADLRKKI